MPPTATLPTVSDCEGCGVCCLHMGYPTYIRESDTGPGEPAWQDLPANLKQELLRDIERYEPPAAGQLDGPCTWFDQQTRRCKHHQHRPQVCRDFQVGSRNCLDWRRHYQNRILSRPSSGG